MPRGRNPFGLGGRYNPGASQQDILNRMEWERYAEEARKMGMEPTPFRDWVIQKVSSEQASRRGQYRADPNQRPTTLGRFGQQIGIPSIGGGAEGSATQAGQQDPNAKLRREAEAAQLLAAANKARAQSQTYSARPDESQQLLAPHSGKTKRFEAAKLLGNMISDRGSTLQASGPTGIPMSDMGWGAPGAAPGGTEVGYSDVLGRLRNGEIGPGQGFGGLFRSPFGEQAESGNAELDEWMKILNQPGGEQLLAMLFGGR